MGILARLRLAKIRTMARPNSPDMPPKRTKKVRLGISIVVCEVLKYHHLAFILTLLTSDSAVTNNRRRRGRPTEMKNHT